MIGIGAACFQLLYLSQKRVDSTYPVAVPAAAADLVDVRAELAALVPLVAPHDGARFVARHPVPRLVAHRTLYFVSVSRLTFTIYTMFYFTQRNPEDQVHPGFEPHKHFRNLLVIFVERLLLLDEVARLVPAVPRQARPARDQEYQHQGMHVIRVLENKYAALIKVKRTLHANSYNLITS